MSDKVVNNIELQGWCQRDGHKGSSRSPMNEIFYLLIYHSFIVCLNNINKINLT